MHGCAYGVSSVGGERTNQRRRDALFRSTRNSSINIVLGRLSNLSWVTITHEFEHWYSRPSDTHCPLSASLAVHMGEFPNYIVKFHLPFEH
jgi:hypothetical protein